MRVEGPRASDNVRKGEKARKSGAASSDFKSFLDGEAEGAGEAASAPGVGGIGALIAAQAAEDPLEGRARKRMQARAGQVLDALDGVHRGLLSGRLSTQDMERVAASVAAQREKIADPALSGLLDEVDLRAKVELAKMEIAKEKL